MLDGPVVSEVAALRRPRECHVDGGGQMGVGDTTGVLSQLSEQGCRYPCRHHQPGTQPGGSKLSSESEAVSGRTKGTPVLSTARQQTVTMLGTDRR
eukprot:165646-Chlamydomonas_euryale.AAC.6